MSMMSLVWFAMGAVVVYTMLQLGGTGRGGLALRPAADRHHAVPCPPPHPRGKPRKSLVFAAVGEGWTADK